MVIALVSDAVLPYHKGGKEKRLYELSTRLAKRGHDVHIYTMKWWDGPKDKIEDGVHLHAICKRYPLYIGERRSIKEGVLFGISCLKLMTKSFDIVDVDHIPFFPLYSVWVVSKLKGKPMFATWHEVWGKDSWLDYMGKRGHIGAAMERVGVHLPYKIVSISVHTKERLINNMHYNGEVIVISPGLDLKAIKSIKVASKKNDIIYAGRLLKHKNIDMLIKAVAELKANGQTPSCLIIGEGPEKRRLIKLAEKLNVSDLVKFNDFYHAHDDLLSQFKASRVFALPSSREGFGIVAIEANACGIPVVTNYVPDNAAKDLVKHGSNGFHFNNSVKTLAEELDEALDAGASLEHKCLNFAKDFDWDKLARHSDKVYSQ